MDDYKLIDQIFDTLDDFLCAGNFAAVDQWLKEYEVVNQKSTILVAILSITHLAASELSEYASFFNRVELELLRQGLNTETLLLGFRR